MKNICAIIFGLFVCSPFATAQTTQPATSTVVSGKLTSEFAEWAGSEENSAALVNGLRTGTSITLISNEPGSTTATTTTFEPTTRPMGYGNIRIALSLAKTQLAMQGVTEPTTEQIQGALVGTGDSTQGILQMRASGMGWGQIANSMGTKLGTVMSGKAPPSTPSNSRASAGAGSGRGVASENAGASRSHKGIVTGSGMAAGNPSARKSSGITTASGVAGGKVTTGLGHAYGQSAGGVVTAGGGRVAGAAANSNAGGNGKGGGKP